MMVTMVLVTAAPTFAAVRRGGGHNHIIIEQGPTLTSTAGSDSINGYLNSGRGAKTARE